MDGQELDKFGASTNTNALENTTKKQIRTLTNLGHPFHSTSGHFYSVILATLYSPFPKIEASAHFLPEKLSPLRPAWIACP